jgi:hypothetical protein
MKTARLISSVAQVGLLCLSLVACSGKSGETTAASSAPATPAAMNAPATAAAQPTSRPTGSENNPTGDIPDTQKYVGYSATGVYRVEVPEGWARSVNGNTVTFINNRDGEAITLVNASAPPAASLSSAPAKAVLATAHAPSGSNVRIVPVTKTRRVILLSFASDSDVNPVTGTKARLLNKAYIFYDKGHIATLHLWAPIKSDNGDPWEHMAQSFQWL